MKKKVLFMGSFSLPKGGFYGGVHHASTTLRDELVRNDYEVIELDTTIKDISETGVLRRLPSLFIRMLRFSRQIIKNKDAQNLFVFVSAGNSYIDKFIPVSIARILKKNILVFPRSGHVINDLDSTFYQRTVSSVFNKSNYVVCQSLYWKDLFSNHIKDKDKLVVIENWISESNLTDSSDLKFPAYNKHIDTLKIVFISRIEKDKGIDDLIPLALKFDKNNINFEIDIYGAGSYLNEFLDHTKAKGIKHRFNYKGWLDNSVKIETINNYHLTIFPSRTEGFPNAVLDFVLGKIPIVAYNIPMVSQVFHDKIEYYSTDEELLHAVNKIISNYSYALENSKELYSEKTKQNSLNNVVTKLDQICK